MQIKQTCALLFHPKHLFFKPLILFRVAGGWSLSQHALGLRFVASLLQGDFLLYHENKYNRKSALKTKYPVGICLTIVFFCLFLFF